MHKRNSPSLSEGAQLTLMLRVPTYRSAESAIAAANAETEKNAPLFQRFLGKTLVNYECGPKTAVLMFDGDEELRLAIGATEDGLVNTQVGPLTLPDQIAIYSDNGYVTMFEPKKILQQWVGSRLKQIYWKQAEAYFYWEQSSSCLMFLLAQDTDHDCPRLIWNEMDQ
jgi:hypothetical protein